MATQRWYNHCTSSEIWISLMVQPSGKVSSCCWDCVLNRQKLMLVLIHALKLCLLKIQSDPNTHFNFTCKNRIETCVEPRWVVVITASCYTHTCRDCFSVISEFKHWKVLSLVIIFNYDISYSSALFWLILVILILFVRSLDFSYKN